MTYEHLTDDEFLSVISSKSSLTQIESELIRRLQNALIPIEERDEYKRGYESGHEDGYQEAKEEFSEE